jgi:hypothetical protein
MLDVTRGQKIEGRESKSTYLAGESSSSLLVSRLTTTAKDAEDLDVVAANCRYDGSSVIYHKKDKIITK